ncbi:hypothetical protein [Methylobacterium nigriterrae]|uniref:hypothetical protein n=1 Tax=Methylobacterium nigriterrae TaxID=3127512 RepID=UPI0030133B04
MRDPKFSRLSDRILDQFIATADWAEKKELPPSAVLAAALEVSANLLAYEFGEEQVAVMLERLAEMWRGTVMFEYGWILGHLQQHK